MYYHRDWGAEGYGPEDMWEAQEDAWHQQERHTRLAAQVCACSHAHDSHRSTGAAPGECYASGCQCRRFRRPRKPTP